jgi:two-component system response regulator PilR (NtrC family)
VARPKGTVLVVDDDAAIRLLCRVNLELDGWEVREAGSIADARARLADGAVGIVLLDVHVGHGSGLELLDEIRADRPAVRVAMLTGSIGTPTLDNSASPDAVISKPFTLEQLRGTVADLAR